MQYNIEEVHCNAALHSVIQANLQLMSSTVQEALQPVRYGKSDTIGLDGIAESTIAASLSEFDPDSVLVTEEIGARKTKYSLSSYSKANRATYYVSDPIDRSSPLRHFLSEVDPHSKVGDVFEDKSSIARWEDDYGSPAEITGATSSLTCIRFQLPLGTAILNLITQEVYVAYREGVFRLKLPSYRDCGPDDITLKSVREADEDVMFPGFDRTASDLSAMRNFVAYVGKPEYIRNLHDSAIIRAETREYYNEYLGYNLKSPIPGGPNRPLFLSNVHRGEERIGFVMANGEKITEWVHWLPMVRFGAKKLSLYEVSQEPPWTRDGILMSTPPPYSVFVHTSDHQDEFRLDSRRMRAFDDPSKIRSTLLLAPATNSWTTSVMEGLNFRQIEFPTR